MTKKNKFVLGFFLKRTFAKNEFVSPSFLSQFVKLQRNMYSTTQQLQISIFWKEILFLFH